MCSVGYNVIINVIYKCNYNVCSKYELNGEPREVGWSTKWATKL